MTSKLAALTCGIAALACSFESAAGAIPAADVAKIASESKVARKFIESVLNIRIRTGESFRADQLSMIEKALKEKKNTNVEPLLDGLRQEMTGLEGFAADYAATRFLDSSGAQRFIVNVSSPSSAGKELRASLAAIQRGGACAFPERAGDVITGIKNCSLEPSAVNLAKKMSDRASVKPNVKEQVESLIWQLSLYHNITRSSAVAGLKALDAHCVSFREDVSIAIKAL